MLPTGLPGWNGGGASACESFIRRHFVARQGQQARTVYPRQLPRHPSSATAPPTRSTTSPPAADTARSPSSRAPICRVFAFPTSRLLSADGAGPIKHGELPSARQRIVAKDVAGIIIAADFEVAMIRCQPRVEHFGHFDGSA